ncbi:MAG: RagB/SusD family nutrient uptake outer membrane protein [Tenuifilaceae bacterium]
MRKILIILLLALSACESNLDLEPKMQISADEAFSSKENVYAALIGCYDALQLQHYYGRNLIIVGDIASDNSIATGTKIEYYSVDDNSLLSDNILVEGIWADIYTAINRVNYMLKKMEVVDFLTDQEKLDYIGQLRFMRALHYFNLVRLYGGVPLKTNPTVNADQENFLPRSSISDIYDSIINDLEFAEQNISNSQSDKATVNAAKSLLASVHLTLGNYIFAAQYSNEVLQVNPFLEDQYSSLFRNSSEPSSEIVFYIPFNANDKSRLAEYHLPNQLGGRYENSPSSRLLSKINPSDERKNLIASSYKGKYYTNKYSDLTTGADKVIVLRVAELLFIRAEANYYIDSISNYSNILADINTIRNRAKLPSISDLTGTTLLKTIEDEKQIEFAFEGKRWFDLIRTKKAIRDVSTVTTSYQMLFPIPLSEILANPLIDVTDQNEGY